MRPLNRPCATEGEAFEKDDEFRHIAAGVRDIVAVPIERHRLAVREDDGRGLVTAVASAHFNRPCRRRRKFQAVEEPCRLLRNRLTHFSYPAQPFLQRNEVSIKIRNWPAAGSSSVESCQPERAALGRIGPIAVIPAYKNILGPYALQLFREQKVQRGQVGDWLRNRERCLGPESGSTDGHHRLIHVRAVLSVDLSN